MLLLAIFVLVMPIGLGKELTLSEATQLALANHPDIKRAQLQVSVAELQFSAAQVRSVLPTLSLSLSPSPGTWFEGNLSAALSFPVGTMSKLSGHLTFQPGPSWNSSWNLRFSFSLDLTNPTAAEETLVSLGKSAEEARVSLEKTKASVVVSIITGYLDLLSREVKVGQAEDARRKAEQNLKAVEEKFSAGLAGRTDLLEARLSFIQAELSYQQTYDAYQSQKARFLQEQLGLKEDVELSPVSLDEEKIVTLAHELLASLDIEAAVEVSREVQAAQEKMEEAKRALDRTKLSWLPTISLELGAGPQGFTLGWAIQFDLFSPDHADQIKLSELQVALAELSLETARSTVRKNLGDLRTALLSALQALERLPLEEEQWQLKQEINRQKHEAGLLSESEWFEFQRQRDAFLLEAQQRLANVLVAYLNLQAALGRSVAWEGW